MLQRILRRRRAAQVIRGNAISPSPLARILLPVGLDLLPFGIRALVLLPVDHRALRLSIQAGACSRRHGPMVLIPRPACVTPARFAHASNGYPPATKATGFGFPHSPDGLVFLFREMRPVRLRDDRD